RSSRRSGGDQSPQAREQVKTNASADDRTNTVVVVGPPDTLTIVAQVLHDLDANPAAESSVFIYHMKNGQAQNVQDVVNYIFNGQPGSTPTRSSNSSSSNRGSSSISSNRSSSSSGFGG